MSGVNLEYIFGVLL